MEAADEILLLTLRQIDCKELPANMATLNEIDGKVYVGCAAHLINTIMQKEKYKTKLPRGVASRHRLCAGPVAWAWR